MYAVALGEMVGLGALVIGRMYLIRRLRDCGRHGVHTMFQSALRPFQ